MFKKSLIAAAVLAAATTAAAADVTVYGKADVGLAFTSVKNGVDSGRTNTLHELNGQTAGSRWGLKGVEDLGNGLKVGFILENSFNTDDGTLGQNSRLFGRESRVYIDSPYGRLSFGRLGCLMGGANGGKIGAISALGTSWDVNSAQIEYMVKGAGRVDNAVEYQTPTFAGLTGYVQYSMKKDTVKGSGTENKTDADRYLAGAVTYKNGPINGVLIVDSTFYKTNDGEHRIKNAHDKSLSVALGGSYDFGVAKVYLGGKYFKNTDSITDSKLTAKDHKGWMVTLSASAPVAGGTLIGGVAYTSAENTAKGDDYEFKRLAGTVEYDYPLSKRTNIWALGAVGKDKHENLGGEEKPTFWKVGVGLRHKF
ncbi:MAG: porin [Duodenibacillus sp.]|nr:porin [Duodenibacillus sp.]